MQYLFRAVCLKSTSLAMHSNIIRELQNNSSIMKYKLSIILIHGNYNCMVPGFLEVAQHQLVNEDIISHECAMDGRNVY